PAGSPLAFTLAPAPGHRDRRVGGQSLRHWAQEARQYSIMPWWNSRGDERRHEAFRRLVEIGEPAVPTLHARRAPSPPVSAASWHALPPGASEPREPHVPFLAAVARAGRALRDQRFE